MTNVPGNVREFWKEVYILFDKHYLMDVSRNENWEDFWAEACEIVKKYDEVPCVIDFLSVVSEMITKLAAGRKEQ